MNDVYVYKHTDEGMEIMDKDEYKKYLLNKAKESNTFDLYKQKDLLSFHMAVINSPRCMVDCGYLPTMRLDSIEGFKPNILYHHVDYSLVDTFGAMWFYGTYDNNVLPLKFEDIHPLSPYPYYNKTRIYYDLLNGFYMKSEDFKYYKDALMIKIFLKDKFDIDICYLSYNMVWLLQDELKMGYSFGKLFISEIDIIKSCYDMPAFMYNPAYMLSINFYLRRLCYGMNKGSVLIFYHDDKMIEETKKLEDRDYLLNKIKGGPENGIRKEFKNNRKGRKAKKKTRETKEREVDIRSAYYFKQ